MTVLSALLHTPRSWSDLPAYVTSQSAPFFPFFVKKRLKAHITRSPAVAKVGPTVLVVTDLEGHPRSMIFVIWKGVCHFLLVINSNLGPILHRLATIHPWRTTDRRTDDNGDKAVGHKTVSLLMNSALNLKRACLLQTNFVVLWYPNRTITSIHGCYLTGKNCHHLSRKLDRH